MRTMGNPEDAADGLQDGLISAYRRAGSFRGEAAVTTWLHRIIVNACLDRLRAAKVRRAEPLPDDLDDHGGRGSLVSADATADPADLSVAADRRRQVLAALDTLPPAQKAALVLVDMEGYPVSEVAEMLGVRRGHREVALLPGPGPPGRAARRPRPDRRRATRGEPARRPARLIR